MTPEQKEIITKMNEVAFGNSNNDFAFKKDDNNVDEKIEEVSKKIQIEFYKHSEKVVPLLNKHTNSEIVTILPDLSEEKLVELYEISDEVVNCCLDFLNKTNDDVKFLDNYYGVHKIEFYKNKNNENTFDKLNEFIEHAKYGLDLYGFFRSCYQLETVIRYSKITKEQVEKRIIEVKNLIEESSYFDDVFKKDSNNILDKLSERNKERA